jgi:hypothetical protein
MIVILATGEAKNQEYHGSRPVQANSSHDPISKITSTGSSGRVPA